MGQDDGMGTVKISATTGRAVGAQFGDLFVDSLIIKDRTTGKLYQLYFDGGVMQSVEVTI